jgi:CubicO group peptidase (beta-lactamase class C family)
LIGRAFLVLLAAVVCARGDVAEAARYSRRNGESALLVWKNGRIVFERQANGGADANIFSITKSLAALGTLQAVARGALRLDDRVSETFPAWKSDPRKARITVRQLLAQTSGLATGFEELYGRGVRDKNAAALKLPAVAAPGERFAYGPSHYEALAALAARHNPPPPASWLTVPLTGAKPADLRRDRLGQPYFSAGARLTARQLLALGQLVRRQGWVAVFPVLPSSLMREATQGTAANAMYGLGFWLNQNAGHSAVVERDIEEAIGAGLSPSQWKSSCLSRQAPPDLVAMVGSRGQRVYVVPSRREIIVRLGSAPGFRDPDFLRAYYK